MKHLLIILLLSSFATSTFATNHYFSSSTGSDSNPGTITQPYASISKASAIFSTLSPGDSLLFKAGDTFTGELIASASGNSSSQIVISSYGTGALPIFTITPTTGWTLVSGSVYSKTVNNHPGTIVFYEDGIPLQPEASSSACTDGNWFGNGTTLYYKPTSGTPTSHVVTFANLEANGGYIPAIQIGNKSYITIQNINFTAIGIGVKSFETTAGSNYNVIQNCQFNYCQRGIVFAPGTNGDTGTKILNNYFYRDQCAVTMYTWSMFGTVTGTAGTTTSCTISSNEMSQVGTVDGTTHWNIGQSDYEGIGIQNFVNGTISNNYIHDGFQIGLSWYNLATRSSANNLIFGNKIQNNGKGAIILVGDNNTTTSNYSFNNNKFYNNVFVNTAFLGVFSGAVVIYQGTLTTAQNLFVNNTVVGNTCGVYFPSGNAPYFTIENNIVYNSGKYRFVDWSTTTKPATLTMDYNLYYEDSSNAGGASLGWVLSTTRNLSYMQGQGIELHSIVGTSPLFLNPASYNYNLQSGSPAINAGVNVGLPYSGTAPNIGALGIGSIVLILNKITIK
jgi:hypothetical protein